MVTTRGAGASLLLLRHTHAHTHTMFNQRDRTEELYLLHLYQVDQRCEKSLKLRDVTSCCNAVLHLCSTLLLLLMFFLSAANKTKYIWKHCRSYSVISLKYETNLD